MRTSRFVDMYQLTLKMEVADYLQNPDMSTNYTALKYRNP